MRQKLIWSLNGRKLFIASGDRFRRKGVKSLNGEGNLYSPRGAALAERYDRGATFSGLFNVILVTATKVDRDVKKGELGMRMAIRLKEGRRSTLAVAVAAAIAFSTPTLAGDALLNEAVDFTGQVLFLETGVPGLIIGATRGDETAVFGFGETFTGSGVAPDGDTLMRVGSITKVFTGAVLASMVADGSVRLTDAAEQYLGDGVDIPAMGNRPVRLIDLATHTSGLPREVDRPAGPDDDPFSTLTAQRYFDSLNQEPQLFAAGTAGLYSNFGFDVLALALGRAAGKPYEQVLAERVLEPMGLSDTMLVVPETENDRLMLGHGFEGEELPDVPTPAVMAGASGLYSTANDILKWLQWHSDRSSSDEAEMRLINHAAYVWRDGLDTVYGFDESGEMDAMSLGWVVMQPDGNRPLILQKAGGLQGMFLYHAFAPNRDVGVFVAINEFDFGASAVIAEFANDLIAQLAPR